MVHGTERGELVHHIRTSADRGKGEPAADHLAEDREVGRDAEARLRSTECDPEARDHLVEHEQGTVVRRAPAQRLEEADVGRDEAHVRGDRFDQDRGGLRAVLVQGRVERVDVVVRHDDGVRDRAGRDAGRTGEPERGQAAARLHQERVEVPVVAARELHDLGPTGCAAREAHGGHRGFGAGRHEPRLLDRRDPFADRFDQFDLAWGRCAVRRAVGRGALHRFDDFRVRVAEDRRAPRLHVVEVLAAVGVDDPAAVRTGHEERLAPDRPERADRRVHSTGNARLRALRTSSRWSSSLTGLRRTRARST